MDQVLTNILSNALKYAPGTLLTIETKQEDMKVEISIQDEGPGISHIHLEKLFERYKRVREVGHGLGLGLYISREIITAHQGSISVNSEVGNGTTFRISLPLYPARVDTEE